MGTTHYMGHAHQKDSWGLQQMSGILKASQNRDFDSQKAHPYQDDVGPKAWTALGKKLQVIISTVSILLEKKMQLSNPSQILTVKHCWWEKIPGYMCRIQCAFAKENLLSCSLKLLIKALREATEWWTKESPSSLFNTFKSTRSNSDKIYQILDSVLLPCLQFLKKKKKNLIK